MWTAVGESEAMKKWLNGFGYGQLPVAVSCVFGGGATALYTLKDFNTGNGTAGYYIWSNNYIYYNIATGTVAYGPTAGTCPSLLARDGRSIQY